MKADVTKRWSNANESFLKEAESEGQKSQTCFFFTPSTYCQFTSYIPNEWQAMIVDFWQGLQNHWHNSNLAPYKSGDLDLCKELRVFRWQRSTSCVVWCLPSDGRHCPGKLHHAQKHWDEGLGDLGSSHGSWEVSDYIWVENWQDSTHWFASKSISNGVSPSKTKATWSQVIETKHTKSRKCQCKSQILFSGVSNLRTCFNNSWQRYGWLSGFGNLLKGFQSPTLRPTTSLALQPTLQHITKM